jgi:Na+-translocating ferredoxin:NAD+ oxidoreductase RnfD subunit
MPEGAIKVARMYKSAIILLIIVVGVSSYYLREFPFSVITAALACSVIDLAVARLHAKRKLKIPYTAIITGIIIGAVAPSNAGIILLVLASAIAVLSKHFIKMKSSNIFNPAALGLLISLVVFGVGDQWWIAAPIPIYGVLIAITPILAICAYDARRLYTGVSFSVAMFVASLVLGGFAGLHSLAAFWTAIISVNYFLAFIMVSEPKTSPTKRHIQIIYGVALAVMVSLMSFYKVPYALLLPLIIGNIAYLLYRMKTGSR